MQRIKIDECVKTTFFFLKTVQTIQTIANDNI